MATQTELRQRINQQIIEALTAGAVPPWRRPWRDAPTAGLPANVLTRRPYTGVNPLLLQIATRRHGLRSQLWGTFQQWKALGAKVKPRPAHVPPGEWGCGIVFYKPMSRIESDPDTGEEKEHHFGFLRSYTLFNLDQTEGAQVEMPQPPPETGFADHEPAETAIRATGADIRFGGGRAFYTRDGDFIRCPSKGQFTDLDEYYETLFHELVHWTEHESRLNWNREERGHCYALGELIAEIGACYLAQELGVPHAENLTNHVAYVGSWLRGMKEDARFIFQASAQASRGADYILSFSRGGGPRQPVPEHAGLPVG